MRLYFHSVNSSHSFFEKLGISAHVNLNLLVYRATNGRTGFGSDGPSKKFVGILIEDAISWSWYSRVPICGMKDLSDIERQLQPFAVTFQKAKDGLLPALNEVARYAVHVSNRYKKSSRAITDVNLPLADWLVHHGNISEIDCEYLLQLCSDFSIWRIGSGEFGIHAISVCKNDELYRSHVRKLCIECGMEFISTEDFKDIPQW